MPDAGAFPWRYDIGDPSTAGIEKLARSSGIPFTISSSYRPGDPGYHGYQNAEDLVSSTENMAALATYLYQYSPYLLELIHSDQAAQGGGWFVKNGKRTTAQFYGATTVSQHYNHVHVATTTSALAAAAKGDQVILASDRVQNDDGTPRTGCLPRAAATLIIPFLILGGYLWRI